ncbi:MAG: roadblock/LC7 domain-containing protein [Actinobacteria bacterium]|nr:MAG: roadblock/LC7 domain-containing protein [Actinomycetota bacterium]
MSSSASNLNWLIDRFAQTVPSMRQAVVVSSDGLPLAISNGVDRETADRLSAVSSGMIGLAYGSAGRFGSGSVANVIVEMTNGWLFVTGIRDGSLLCVLTKRETDIGAVAYEMAVFSEKAGDILTPEVREELKAHLVGID